MNIFLDTNAIFRDPFFTKGKNRILIKLAKHDEVKLFLSKTVYSELLRAHRVFLEKEMSTASEALKKISPFVDKNLSDTINNLNIEDLIKDFITRFKEFQEAEQIEIIEYDGDVLERIVEADMYNKAPFIKKVEFIDNNKQSVSYMKKEIRDAILWYSYQLFIEKHELEDCYFISSNVKEFRAPGAKKNTKEHPYLLHPEIEGNIEITAYKNIHDFITHNENHVKALHSEVLTEDLLDKIETELDEGLAKEIINDYFKEEIVSETNRLLSEKQPENLHDDYFVGGYIHPSIDGEISNICLNEIEVYGDDITIAVDIDVDMEVEIYLYNPVHDDRYDKFQYQATDTIRVTESLVFLIPIDTEKDLDAQRFSLREYIKEIKPDNLNVEFIQLKNIDHVDMFPEEDFEE